MKNILHLLRGQEGERLAVRYLERHGMKIVARNVRIGGGEIDVIGEEGGVIVFVEVRLRKAGAAVSAAESITPGKQQKWHRAAQAWLQRHYPQALPDCRFDALCIARAADGTHALEWLRGVDVG